MGKRSFISPEQRSGIRARVEPIALAMSRAGLTPNMLTLIGFGIASLGGVLAAVEWWLLAGIVATAGAGFDMFDGAVARATGQVSKLGAFMDSTFDRWGEGVVYVGIVIGPRKPASTSAPGWRPRRWCRPSWSATPAPRASRWASRVAPAWPPSASPLARCARSSSASPSSAQASSASLPTCSTWAACILAIGLGLIAVLATITVVQRIRFVTSQPPDPGD